MLKNSLKWKGLSIIVITPLSTIRNLLGDFDGILYDLNDPWRRTLALHRVSFSDPDYTSDKTKLQTLFLWVLSLHFDQINQPMFIFFRQIFPIVKKNKEREKAKAVVSLVTGECSTSAQPANKFDQMDNIVDIREYDVPYYVRVSIDMKINVVSIVILLLFWGKDTEEIDAGSYFVNLSFSSRSM